MSKLILKGHGKTVIVDGNNITIKYSWYIGQGIGKEKIVPFSQITSVQVKKPGLLGGYILFQTVGGLNNSINKNAQDVYKDENGITFNSNKNYKIALDIKRSIESGKGSTSRGESFSEADEIVKFKKLFDDGIITEPEYREQKRKLLNI